MSQAADRRFMALALGLGRRGLGRVWPNPAVGCVIVRQGRIVGRGWTADGGRPHAETQALAQAGAAAKGATVYVTLEPCAHHGRTPPCADALVAAGVARVLVATGDPNPQVAGAGLDILRRAGIVVEVGVMQAEADSDHAGFLLTQTDNRPFVTLKLAGSLDGRIATFAGHSQWITGPAARRAVHLLRARHDAVMIGAGTARADDPSLTVRDVGIARQPVRVVVSRLLDLPADGQLARTAREVPLWLCHGSAARAARWEKAGAVCLDCGQGDRLAMRDVLSKLAAGGLTRVLCEGGGALAASLLSAQLVDELVLFHGGVAIGADGVPSLGDLDIQTLDQAPHFALRDVRTVGPDVMTRWVPARQRAIVPE
jgi:diaminohydroxyphosphoribosylaminopyrimidine deaminase/5-amino-6-(5-phosphoribosylamino)uracil reductase